MLHFRCSCALSIRVQRFKYAAMATRANAALLNPSSSLANFSCSSITRERTSVKAFLPSLGKMLSVSCSGPTSYEGHTPPIDRATNGLRPHSLPNSTTKSVKAQPPLTNRPQPVIIPAELNPAPRRYSISSLSARGPSQKARSAPCASAM